MRRRDFLKSVAALCGAASIPQLAVAAPPETVALTSPVQQERSVLNELRAWFLEVRSAGHKIEKCLLHGNVFERLMDEIQAAERVVVRVWPGCAEDYFSRRVTATFLDGVWVQLSNGWFPADAALELGPVMVLRSLESMALIPRTLAESPAPRASV